MNRRAGRSSGTRDVQIITTPAHEPIGERGAGWRGLRPCPRLCAARQPRSRCRRGLRSCALVFAASWQGTHLECYLSSWPYQLLLVALLVKLLVTIRPPHRVAAAAGSALAGIAVVSWYG